MVHHNPENKLGIHVEPLGIAEECNTKDLLYLTCLLQKREVGDSSSLYLHKDFLCADSVTRSLMNMKRDILDRV